MNQIRSATKPSGMPYSGTTAVQTIEELSQIIEDEMMRIIPLFLKRRSLKRMQRFIDENRVMLYFYAEKRGALSPAAIRVLDARSKELKGLAKNRQGQVRRSARRQRVRFWIPVTISLVALMISATRLLAS